MLREVNPSLFRAPEGARIQLVVDSQDNIGAPDATFEYDNRGLTRETVGGLPGCSFTVAGHSAIVQVGVVFNPASPAKARYDLFEVENGGKSDLRLSVKHSDSTPEIAFSLEPVPATAMIGLAPGGPPPSPFQPPAAAARKKKAAAKKKAAKKKTAAKRKTAPKKKKAAKRR